MFGFGKKPQNGAMPPSDGSINFTVSISKDKVVMNFGRPVAWIGFTPQEAARLAELLLQKTAIIVQRPKGPEEVKP